MAGYKLIAADLDDTLLNDQLQVSPRNKRAFTLAREKGIIVTVATGRMFRSALPIARELGIKGPIMTYQGALVKGVADGKVFAHQPVPFELAREVLAEGYKAGIHMNIYLDDNLYVDSVTEEANLYVSQAKVEVFPVGNLIRFLDKEPTKVLFIGEPSMLDALKPQMKDKFGDSLYITKSKPYYLEFMHPKATKMHGLAALAEHFGILPEEVITFGDSYNDIEMLEYAGLGVAMGNSPQEIKNRADLVADTNNNDGVAQIIEKFVLGEGNPDLDKD